MKCHQLFVTIKICEINYINIWYYLKKKLERNCVTSLIKEEFANYNLISKKTELEMHIKKFIDYKNILKTKENLEKEI